MATGSGSEELSGLHRKHGQEFACELTTAPCPTGAQHMRNRMRTRLAGMQKRLNDKAINAQFGMRGPPGRPWARTASGIPAAPLRRRLPAQQQRPRSVLHAPRLDRRFRCHSRLFPGDRIRAGKTAVTYEGRPVDMSVPRQRLEAGGTEVTSCGAAVSTCLPPLGVMCHGTE